MFENRRHHRIREHVDVNWEVNGMDAQGEGSLLNISLTGALLQTDKTFQQSNNCIISIRPSESAALPFVSKKAKVMWFRRIKVGNDRYQCGIQFVSDTTELKDWLEQKIASYSETANVNILNNFVV